MTSGVLGLRVTCGRKWEDPVLRLQAYAHWTYDMARLQPSQARPDEADEVHERAIELAELSSAPAKEVGTSIPP